MKPQRGLLQVRPVETDETLPGGRIALIAETRERMTAWQCEVIEAGAQVDCDDDECERVHTNVVDPYDGIIATIHLCPVKRGDWLLVRPRSYIAGPDTTRAEWFIHQDDVLAILSED